MIVWYVKSSINKHAHWVFTYKWRGIYLCSSTTTHVKTKMYTKYFLFVSFEKHNFTFMKSKFHFNETSSILETLENIISYCIVKVSTKQNDTYNSVKSHPNLLFRRVSFEIKQNNLCVPLPKTQTIILIPERRICDAKFIAYNSTQNIE